MELMKNGFTVDEQAAIDNAKISAIAARQATVDYWEKTGEMSPQLVCAQNAAAKAYEAAIAAAKTGRDRRPTPASYTPKPGRRSGSSAADRYLGADYTSMYDNNWD